MAETEAKAEVAVPLTKQKSTTRILRMEMKGFKSFANKTEVPLGAHYNCIIGPNGSGKSNVLDAICFVLGKGSAREMRVEKSANLIYNGGKTKNPAKEAEVSIYFDNANKAFPRDLPEIKVTRIVRHNGTSIYKLNDETVTRTQILELLTAANIDPDGYNIILQGNITAIINMSPNDRRMIIEEISGIGEYEDKRHKAELELNKVDEQLKEADIVLAERGTYMKELKKERDQAAKFRELEEKVKRNKATILYRKLDERKTKESKFAKQLSEEESKAAEIQKKIDELKTQISQKKERTNEIAKEIQSKGQKEQLELNKQVEQLRVEIGVAANRIDTLKNELGRLSDRRKQLENQEKDLKSKVETIDKDIEVAKKRDSAIEADLKHVADKMAAFRKKHNLEDASLVEEEISAIDKEIDALTDSTAKLRQEEQEILREKDRLEFKIESVDASIQRVLELESENKEQVQELKKDKAELTKNEKELKEALEKAKALHAEHVHCQEKLRSAEDELSKLRSRTIQIKEATAGTIAVKKILEQKNKIKGIQGTIAELGSVKEKHSLALEVAAGTRIRSIVVDDDAVAQKCIEYLKSNKLGVATFLPLNKVRGQHGEVPSSKGVIGLALDLVDYDKKYENAFKYVFGSTVVVEDIQSARQIGIGKYRMVTLSGDLIETSGAMSGGFLQRGKSGGMGFAEKELVDDIAKYEKEVNDLDAVEKVLQKRRDENSEQIEELRTRQAELEANVVKLERILKIDAGDASTDKDEKNKLKKELSDKEKKLDAVQDEISEKNKVIAKKKAEKQKHRESLNQLRNPALLGELQAFEQNRAQLETERITIKTSLASLQGQKGSVFEPELENIGRIYKQQTQEETRFNKELETLSAKKKENEATLKIKEKEAETFYKQFQKLFDERNKLQEDMNKIESKAIEEEDRIRKVEQQKGSINISLAAVRAEIAGIMEEYKQFEGVEPFKTKEQSDIEREIRDFEKMMQDLGAINMKALEIYETVEKEYAELNGKKEVLGKEREEVLVLINEIDSKKKEMFLKMFAIINEQFRKIFVKLNTKGEAFLELENPEDPLNAGMNIKVRLAGTKFLDIRSLSGGEKTMTALAFLFAIQEHEPAQFYIVDEIDAALDKRNAEKLSQLVRQYSEYAQYILISHNDAVITEADQLYGVSMNEHGESKVTSLKV